MRCWFPLSKKSLQNKVGVITDTYGNYVEIWCDDDKDFFIRHIDEIDIIK